MADTTPAWPPPDVAGIRTGTDDGAWRSPGYRSSWLRGQITIGLLLSGAVLGLVATVLDWQGMQLMDAAAAGTLSEADAAAFDNTTALIGLIQLGIYVATVVGVLAWLSRVVENVPPLTGQTPRRSPREAIGWWFVPFANLVIPYRIVADSVRRLRVRDRAGEQLLLPWWVMWLVGGWLGNVLWRLPTETIDEIRTMFAVTMLSDAAMALAAVLLVLIVRTIELGADARARGLGLGRSPVPAWPQPSTTVGWATHEPVGGGAASAGWASSVGSPPSAGGGETGPATATGDGPAAPPPPPR